MLENVHCDIPKRGVIGRRHMPSPHRDDVEHHRDPRVHQWSKRPLKALQPARGGPQQDLVEREDAEDRHQIQQQHVLGHVEAERLLGEGVDW